MKSKLLAFIIIIAVMLPILATPAMADTKIVDITRPEDQEVVTKETFSIFGTCEYDETTITLEYKDRETEEFKPLETTEGTSTFKVGSGKMFGKDFKLKYKGENVIRITASVKDIKEEQVKQYTITWGEEKKKSNWLQDAIKWLTGNDKDTDKDKKD